MAYFLWTWCSILLNTLWLTIGYTNCNNPTKTYDQIIVVHSVCSVSSWQFHGLKVQSTMLSSRYDSRMCRQAYPGLMFLDPVPWLCRRVAMSSVVSRWSGSWYCVSDRVLVDNQLVAPSRSVAVDKVEGPASVTVASVLSDNSFRGPDFVGLDLNFVLRWKTKH